MRIRAFTMLLTVALTLALLVVAPATRAIAGDRSVPSDAPVAVPDEDDAPPPTFNDFLPERRALGDCLGALQRPNCGSEARGGWAQAVVFLAIVAGLAFIAWRIVAGSRRARRDRALLDAGPPDDTASGQVRAGTPDATTARDGDGDAPAP